MIRGTGQLKCDDTRAEITFRLSAKRTSPFKSAGTSFLSTTGSRVVRISGSNAGKPRSEVVWGVLATHSIRQFPLKFHSRESPCAITFQLESKIHLRPSVSYVCYCTDFCETYECLKRFVKNSFTEFNGNRQRVWSLLEVTEKRADVLSTKEVTVLLNRQFSDTKRHLLCVEAV